MWEAFANAKATHIFFFQQYISLYAIFNDQSSNDTLTNDIVSFEQLGPGIDRADLPLDNCDVIDVLYNIDFFEPAISDICNNYAKFIYCNLLFLMLYNVQ